MRVMRSWMRIICGGPLSTSAGTIDRVPLGWKISEERLREPFEKVRLLRRLGGKVIYEQ